ncbi:MAG: STAS/SEC14 domain-containing protein [Pseudomonadota bacterium]
MDTLETTHSISADTSHSELHFAIAGLWNEESMLVFLRDLARAAKPFMQERKSFAALGDLRDFVPQTQETAAAIQNSLLEAKDHGLQRFAVVTTSSLVKMQYRRISAGIEVEFFDEPRDAIAWLRSF